jgi:hypothetical protein
MSRDIAPAQSETKKEKRKKDKGKMKAKEEDIVMDEPKDSEEGKYLMHRYEKDIQHFPQMKKLGVSGKKRKRRD